MIVMSDLQNIKPYTVDLPLLAQLGLPRWNGKIYEEVFVGEVRPYESDEKEDELTRIKIYAKGAPAQFFRFEIIRKSEAEQYTGMERIEVRTGSGTLQEFWPMALSVANHCLAVGIASKL
jgi:hypothetical protein